MAEHKKPCMNKFPKLQINHLGCNINFKQKFRLLLLKYFSFYILFVHITSTNYEISFQIVLKKGIFSVSAQYVPQLKFMCCYIPRYCVKKIARAPEGHKSFKPTQLGAEKE